MFRSTRFYEIADALLRTQSLVSKATMRNRPSRMSSRSSKSRAAPIMTDTRWRVRAGTERESIDRPLPNRSWEWLPAAVPSHGWAAFAWRPVCNSRCRDET